MLQKVATEYIHINYILNYLKSNNQLTRLLASPHILKRSVESIQCSVLTVSKDIFFD
jgi:hypothetical protein